ncbi:hypothetical protein C0036_17010 [Streptomyces sp. DJ]|nr:hypothetical protein C0036_17010 [Streptomyces sp. DJ]
MCRVWGFCPERALRALTVPGCPRMLQVALRACAPRTEQAALASVAGCRTPGFPGGLTLQQSDTGSWRCSTYDSLSVPEPFS